MRGKQFTGYAYPALLALMVLVGLRYPQLSPGLAAAGGDTLSGMGPFYCRDLLSSGGDDDAMVFSFALFLLPLVWRILRWRSATAALEVALFWLCAGLVVMSLWMASLDCAAVFYTAFVVPDPWLAAALLAMPFAAVCLHRRQ